MNDDLMVRTDALTRMFGSVLVLDALTLNVPPRQMLNILGPRGSGKSAVLQMLAGLLRPTSGAALVAGVNPAVDAAQIKRLVGYVPVSFGASPHMRVHEHLGFFAAAFLRDAKEARQRVADAMELTGITAIQGGVLDELGPGARRRVELARALVHDPPVLLVDEPARGLNDADRIQIQQLLLRLKQLGKTIVVTSSAYGEMTPVSDLVAILFGGRLRAFGAVAQVSRHLARRRTMEVHLLPGATPASVAERLRGELGQTAEVTAYDDQPLVRLTTEVTDERLAQVFAAIAAAGGILQLREVIEELNEASLTIRETPGWDLRVSNRSTAMPYIPPTPRRSPA